MNKIIPVLIGLTVLALILPTQVFAPSSSITTSDTLYGCTSSGTVDRPDEIVVLNKTNGSVISSNTWSGTPTSDGCNGLSQDPTDGTWYAIIRENVSGDRFLTTIDPTTGIISSVGVLGNSGLDEDKYNSLAFNSSGTLFATPANLHPNSGDLAIVNTSSGLATEVCTLPSSSFHSLFFNFNDGFLYDHVGSSFGSGDDNRLEKITNTSTCATTTIPYVGGVGTFPSGLETYGSTFNTGDNLTYVNAQDLTGAGTVFYTITSGGVLNVINGSIGVSSFFQMKGFAFELVLGADTTDPVITTTVSEPISIKQDSVFDEFEFVSCIDDTDGDITNSMTTVGTVNTSIPKSYSIDYTCTDVATNESELQVQYLIKRASTGGGGSAPSVSAPSAPSAPAPSGVPTLQFTGDEVDRAFDLFATLNQLFAPSEPEPEPTIPTAPSAPTAPTPTVPRESFIDAIRSFFSSLFG